jgi:hypothetical protein
MNTRHALVLASLVVAAACTPFYREPVSEVRRDVNVNSRWRASLAAPAALAGAVQMHGSAAMQPTGNGQGTLLSLSISNATPGGVQPWRYAAGSAAPIRVLSAPDSGDYFVTVSASAAKPETVVASGNLAPPARYGGRA